MSAIINVLDLIAGVLMVADLATPESVFGKLDNMLRNLLSRLNRVNDEVNTYPLIELRDLPGPSDQASSYQLIAAAILALVLSLAIVVWGAAKDIVQERFTASQVGVQGLVILGGVSIGSVVAVALIMMLSRRRAKSDWIELYSQIVIILAALFVAVFAGVRMMPSLPGSLVIGIAFGVVCMVMFLGVLDFLRTWVSPQKKAIVGVGLLLFILARVLALTYG
jgi:hypothetical protein